MGKNIKEEEMYNLDVESNLQEALSELTAIKNIIDKNKLGSSVPYLVNYAVIRSSGCLERCYKQLVFDFLQVDQKHQLNKYLKNNVLESSSNPNTGNILKTLQGLDGQWSEKFKKHITEISSTEEHKSNLNNLVQSRNDFAHGVNLSNFKIDTIIKNLESGIYILRILDCVLNDTEVIY